MKKLLITTLSIIFIFCIFLCIDKIYATEPTAMYLDEPYNLKNVTKDLNVAGWVMSTENVQLKLYINGEYIRDLDRNTKRPDVLQAIKGYGDSIKNPNPGFNYTVDVSNLKSANYNLRIDVLNKDTSEKIDQMETIFIKSPSKAIAYVDSLYMVPIITDNNLLVKGWLMSETDVKINLYIDNTFITEIERNMQRPDVLKAISGYGTSEENPNPGFSTDVDITDLETGNHTVKLEVVQKESNEVIYVKTEKFIKKSIEMFLDAPCNMQSATQNLNVAGWVMSAENIELKLYIDDEYIMNLERNTKRDDVLRKIKGYGDTESNPTPGFNYEIDISNYASGIHKLKIEFLNKDTSKRMEQIETNFKKEQGKAICYIDTLSNDQFITNNNLLIKGWMMSNANVTTNLYIDDILIDELERNMQRPDVLKAISGYGTNVENPTPGFSKNVDISDLEEGRHTVKIEVLQKGNNEIIYNRIVTFIKDEAQMYLDMPQSIKNDVFDTLKVYGWVMSNQNIKINAYIDDNFVKELTRNKERQDVLNAIKGYGDKTNNPIPGFDYTIDLSKYNYGMHNLKIEVINADTSKKLEEINKEFKISIPKVNAYIDSPYLGQVVTDKKVLFEGWVMSETDVKLKAYINNNFVKQFDRNNERQDVLNVIKGYGDKSVNPKPGFRTELDLSSYEYGKYDIRLDIISKNSNKVLATLSTTITLKEADAIRYGIDISNHQGDIDWKKVKNDGIDFAIIRAGFRGYGSSGSMNIDERFEYNIKNALANNIDVGIYFFSQATTIEEALEEAEYTLNLIKGYKITYPVIIDVEYANSAHSGRADNLSVEDRTNVVIAFCNKIKEAGYIPMYYTDKWFLTNNLDSSKLQNYEYWLAHYTGATRDNPLALPSNYTGKYSIWQYTSSGSVDGIEGNVDMDIGYKNY